MSYFAELDDDQLVVRVIVADDLQWIVDNLGGTWVETADPYAAPTEVTYAGLGMGHAGNMPDLFAPVWDEVAATTPDSEGNWLYNGGEVVWHEQQLWVNVTEGVPNTWEPGVSGWHDQPDQGLPQWVQPTGAHDAYALGAEVTHNGGAWVSTIAANVYEPGVYGWDPIDYPLTDPAAFRIPLLEAWVDSYPNLADEVLAAEQARGTRARRKLIRWLQGFIAHRDDP